MYLRKLFIFTLLSLSLFSVHAESFFSSADLTAEVSPAVYINSESKSVSAPSPIIYPVGIGVLWPNYTTFAIQPMLSFFTMYHLWYNGQALPAEIENRTSQTICLLLNMPGVATINLGDNSRLQFFAGPAIFMRFGALANGVKDSDSGYSGTAGSDVDEINSYFWNNARFLYLSFGSAWQYNFTSHFRIGPSFYAYLPLGSLFSGEGVQAMIVSLGLKLSIHY